MIIFKYKGETEAIEYLNELDENFVTKCRFYIEDSEAGKKVGAPVLANRIDAEDLGNIKGFEAIYSLMIDKVDQHLNSIYSNYELLGWTKDPIWNWHVKLGKKELIVVDLGANKEDSYPINTVDKGDGRLSFSCWLKTKNGKKKTEHFSLSLETLNLKAWVEAVVDTGAIRSDLDRVAQEEGQAGKKAFLEAMSRLGPQSDLSLLNDFGKAKYAQAISRHSGHQITDVDEAYEVIKDYNLFIGNDPYVDVPISLHEEILYCPD